MNSIISGTPFLKKKLSIRTTPFLHEFKFGELSTNLEHSSGYALRIEKKDAIKASMGEHIERISVVKSHLKNPDKNTFPTLPAFNLIDGNIMEVDADRLFLNPELPIFEGIRRDFNFNDTCGLAAHISSHNVIKAGLKEFIERQSLVYNWLSKTPGRLIHLNELSIKDEENIHKITRIAEYASDEFFCFNISLIDSVYVVLTIGYKGKAISSALGTDTCLKKAIENSLYEYIMILDSSISLNQHNMKYLDQKNVYSYNFYSLEKEEFLSKVSYLFEESKIDITTECNNTNADIIEIASEMKKKYNVNIYACYLPFIKKDLNVKVAKVLSLEGFPHINTKLFNPRDYSISEKLPSHNYPNTFNAIPFA